MMLPTHCTAGLFKPCPTSIVAIVKPALGKTNACQPTLKGISRQVCNHDSSTMQKNHNAKDHRKIPVLVATTCRILQVTSSAPKY